jgi:hypothetical protein
MHYGHEANHARQYLAQNAERDKADQPPAIMPANPTATAELGNNRIWHEVCDIASSRRGHAICLCSLQKHRTKKGDELPSVNYDYVVTSRFLIARDKL